MKKIYILLISIIILLLIDGITLKFFIKESPIHGLGVFSTKNYQINDKVFDQMMDENNVPKDKFDSPIRYINHSKNGNILMKRRVDGKWEVRAIKKILVAYEIVSDYDKSPPFVSGPKPHYV